MASSAALVLEMHDEQAEQRRHGQSTHRPANAITNVFLMSSRAMNPLAPVVELLNCVQRITRRELRTLVRCFACAHSRPTSDHLGVGMAEDWDRPKMRICSST